MWWRALLAIVCGFIAIWLVIIALLWQAQRHTTDNTTSKFLK